LSDKPDKNDVKHHLFGDPLHKKLFFRFEIKGLISIGMKRGIIPEWRDQYAKEDANALLAHLLCTGNDF